MGINHWLTVDLAKINTMPTQIYTGNIEIFLMGLVCKTVWLSQPVYLDANLEVGCRISFALALYRAYNQCQSMHSFLDAQFSFNWNLMSIGNAKMRTVISQRHTTFIINGKQRRPLLPHSVSDHNFTTHPIPFVFQHFIRSNYQRHNRNLSRKITYWLLISF